MLFKSKPFDCAIDLGTSKLVLTDHSGEQFEMPSYVAVKKDTPRGPQVIAMGANAKVYHGRTNDEIDVVRPIARGVVAHQQLSSELVKHALRKFDLLPTSSFFSKGPSILVSHPIELSPVEQKAFARSCLDAGASKVSLVAEPLAAGAGVFEDHWSASSKMIVDFGAGVVEAVAFSGKGILAHSSMRWGSDDIDIDIEKYLQQMHHLWVGPLSAEEIKHEAARQVLASPGDRSPIEVRGYDIITRRPKRIHITSSEIKLVLEKRVDMLVHGIILAFEKIPPAAFEEIADRGLMITGGGAWLSGFLGDLDERLKLPVIYDHDPSHSVCRGELAMMRDPQNKVLSLIAG